MDDNKLKKLQEIGYRINRTCGLCIHAEFPSNDWGTCKAHTYGHLKHSDSLRQLSIHKAGGCSQWAMIPEEQQSILNYYADFIVEDA